jgi:RNA-splicing ligase RtcB
MPKELCYLENKLKDDYIHDMQVVQKYADINRSIIAKKIVNERLGLNFDDLESFQTIHNYIDLENNILRKGAVSAMLGEKLLIPINMRDGSLICEGLGNPDWNLSAPHGAGRLMSRTQAKASLNMEDFRESMEGVFSTCVNTKTLDEAPMSYKPIEEILKNIKETVKVIKHIKPLYNYKAE